MLCDNVTEKIFVWFDIIFTSVLRNGKLKI